MKMVTVVLVWLVMSSSIGAQERGIKEERLQAQKVSFITTKLDLSQEEAKVFWPVYDDYQEESRAIRSKLKELSSKVTSSADVSDQEAGSLVSQMLSAEEEEIQLKRRYVAQLEPTIGYKKIAVLFSLEREFREQILRNLKRKMRDRR